MININNGVYTKSSITISTIEELDILVAFTSSYFHNHNIDDEIYKIVHIVIDEIAMNVITHGFSQANNDFCFITTEIIIKEDEMIVIFQDNGIEFNPIAYDANIDFNLPIAEREIGGLGLVIVKHYADKLEYKFEDGKNIFTFIIKLSRINDKLVYN
jgi:anti-sigma regulatory factor (Ser/Thr protein kinase)